MLNVKRWKELKELEKNNPEKLAEMMKELDPNIIFARKITAMDVMIAENKRDYPEEMKNISDWLS